MFPADITEVGGGSGPLTWQPQEVGKSEVGASQTRLVTGVWSNGRDEEETQFFPRVRVAVEIAAGGCVHSDGVAGDWV